MLIVHAGNVNAEFRDPRPLMRAMRIAADRGRIQLDKVRLRFVGGGEFCESQEVRAALLDTRLVSNVEIVARVPYYEALLELARADLLLLLQASEDTLGLVPAKLYEYLRSEKPVLALVWPGATSEVLATTRSGWAVDPRNPEALIDAVSDIYEAWLTNSLKEHCASLDVLRRFDRRTLAAQLATVFADASGHPSPA